MSSCSIPPVLCNAEGCRASKGTMRRRSYKTLFLHGMVMCNVGTGVLI